MYLNKAFVYGNLVRDPELKSLPSGIQVCSFSIATNRTYKDKAGAKQEAVEYHNIVAFARLAELVSQYMKKGSGIFVEGRLQTRSWEAEGQKKYRTEIVAESIQFGPKGGSGNGGGSYGDAGASSGGSKAKAAGADKAPSGEAIEYPEEEINPDDIPF